MQMVELVLCSEREQHWDDYFLFLLLKYKDLGLPYDFEMAFSFVGNPMMEGDSLIARDKASNRIVGAIGFVFGTGADQFADHSVCQIEVLYIEKQWRRTRLFSVMVATLAEFLQRRHPETGIVQFWAPADRNELLSLFGKLGVLIKTNDKSFGRISLYRTNPQRMLERVGRCVTRGKDRPYEILVI